MSDWITYLWQSNISLLVFYLGYVLWLRKEQCFNYRRIYLITGSLASLALPLMRFPSLSNKYITSLEIPPINLPQLSVAPSYSGLDLQWILVGTYTLISLWFAGLILLKLWKTFWLIKKCRPSAETYQGHSVYLTNGQFPSSSFFQYLLWDNTHELDSTQKQLILDHEVVHINHGHSYDILFLELLKVFFWFNPVVWLIHREIRNVHEYIADTKVTSNDNQQKYISFLAQQTLHQFNIPWVHHFNKNLTLKRISMILSSQHPTRIWKYGILAGLYVFLHVFISCTDEQPISDEVFTMVDERPFPVNGMEAFYQELGTVLKYPTQARRMGIEGKVYVSFVVQKSGELTDIKVLKGIGAGCDKEAKAALSKVSAWNPGIHEGEPVKVIMQMPIIFKLSHEDDEGA